MPGLCENCPRVRVRHIKLGPAFHLRIKIIIITMGNEDTKFRRFRRPFKKWGTAMGEDIMGEVTYPDKEILRFCT